MENARRASSDRGQVNPCYELSVPIVTAGAEGGAVLLKFFTAWLLKVKTALLKGERFTALTTILPCLSAF